VNTVVCVDVQGEPIAVGENVRILSIPPWLTHDLPEDEVAALKKREGTVMRVVEIDAHGYIWFGTDNTGRWFCLRPSEVQVVPS
jgi:hypothetical protein